MRKGGEFDHQPRIPVTSRADSTWVDKSWRRQTLMNSKERLQIRGGLVENQRSTQALFLVIIKGLLLLHQTSAAL